MEVTSSTTTSDPEEASDSLTQETAAASSPTSQAALAVVTTSSEGSDGLNNTLCTDVSSGPVDAVRYGPCLPPSFYPSENFHYSKDVKDSKAVHGSCGLHNLGNTCFMNSGLQSLFSCAPLVKFFCESYTLTEINRHSLTAQFYILLCKVWSGQFSVVHPRAFKDFLGFYHSQFEDYRQHDCQEFLALVLDTLHEQLNTSAAALAFASSASAAPLPPPFCIMQHPSDRPQVVSNAIALPWHDAAPISSSAPSSSLHLADEQVVGTDSLSDGVDGESHHHHHHHRGTELKDSPASSSTDREDIGVIRKRDADSELSASPPPLSMSHCVPRELTADQSPPHQAASSPTSEMSLLEEAMIPASPSSHGGEPAASGKSPELCCEDEEITSSSFPPLKRYTSRSNIDDVTSSDSGSGVSTKPCLKRVSSGSSVTASGLLFTSEDSNHSSVSAHSTDSEQSSAFKRLKIEAKELNRNSSNNNVKDCVTSTSDCRKGHRTSRKCVSGEDLQEGLREAQVTLISSNNVSASGSGRDLKVIDNMVNMYEAVESCGEAQPSSHTEAKTSNDNDDLTASPSLAMGLPNLEDFYSKETKTLNTNVLVSDFLQEITSDSEKFAKVDNRNRPPSKEVNILQEAAEEEDKTEKVLLGQRFSGGVKATNLYIQPSGGSGGLGKAMKMNTDPNNILNNSFGHHNDPSAAVVGLVVGQVSKFALDEPELISGKVDEENLGQPLTLKLAASSSSSSPLSAATAKLDEEEKNVQMQAFAKFNTCSVQSNIRTDLTDKVADSDAMEVDEVELDSSEEEEELELASHSSTVEECSGVPNCLRHCPPPSEVAMANAAWEDYLSRNRSVVVNTFQGQFRSTVVCSECCHVSVTYEPFMYLSLPIPHAMEQQMSVTYVCQHSPPVRYLLNLLKTDKVGTAKTQLKELVGQSSSGEIVMAEVLDSHISRILDDNILLKYVNTFNRLIYAFEVVSVEDVSDLEAGSPPCQHILNNEESPSLQYDCDLPSTCREELPYVSDSQLSNQSFDSVNVNSPSSRDTLDYVFSDSEACEPSVGVNNTFCSPSSLNTYMEEEEEERQTQECQSTSDEGVTMTSASSRSPPSLAPAAGANSSGGLHTLHHHGRRLSSSLNEQPGDSEEATGNSDGTVVLSSDVSTCGDGGVLQRLSAATPGVDDNSGSGICSTSSFWTDGCEDRVNKPAGSSSPPTAVCGSSSPMEGDEGISAALPCAGDGHGRDSNRRSPVLCSSNNKEVLSFGAVACLDVDSNEVAQDGSLNCVTTTTTTTTPPTSHAAAAARVVDKNTMICPPTPATFPNNNINSSSNSSIGTGNSGHHHHHHHHHAAISSTSGVGSSYSSAGNSSSNSSRHSRSCPSPEQLSASQSANSVVQDSTLLAVASRLGGEEEPGTYFLQPPTPPHENYNLYPEDDGTGEGMGANSQLEDHQPEPCSVDTSWSTFPTAQTLDTDLQARSLGPDSSSSVPVEWRSCAICLEDLLDTELLTHIACSGVFCHNCLQMSVKHTADVATFCCPICLQPANVCEDFVPLASASTAKPKIRMLPVSVAYRHSVRDNTGVSTLQLYGHPHILHTPSVVSGRSLYSMVDTLLSCMADRLVGSALTTYTILLTDGQGLSCSRCPYSCHCTGCEVAREGELTLQPSDCLTVHAGQMLATEEVRELGEVRDDVSMEGMRSSQPTTIMDCFGAFTQSETLDEHNPWYCPQCEQNQCAKKTMTVWRYPDNLIIHLKRFVYQDLSSTKVDTKVIFPHTDMDVRGFLSGPSTSGLVYDLYSTVCHFGGASAGHYTCFARHPLTGEWYYYNDETVAQQTPADSEYSSGYLLFYQRQGQNVDFTPPQNVALLEDETNFNLSTTTATAASTTAVAAASSSATSSTSVSASSSSSQGTAVTINVSSPSHSSNNVSRSAAATSPASTLQPPTSSSSPSTLLSWSQKAARKEEEEEEEDYDDERRGSSLCGEESFVIHFGSGFPEHPDHRLSEEGAGAGGEGGQLLIAEPDSTLDFYS
ncbi:uncharacterized protein LOC101853362 [Aplysia californica]|uniref:ubiquitinyl hydrolase 1 n=1 Tax=Aplysia californica TaxID=6500 RepID=A0ABM0JBY3_APLCA|nr:uncharacterized protein LOC101853362 [Aplysia californica]